MDAIIKGMATIYYASVWADRAEHADYPMCGIEITDHMGEIPVEAYIECARALGHIEHANGVSWPVLFAQAWRADYEAGDHDKPEPEHEDYHGELAERFGGCLAFMSMGTGVSWFDDHARFPLKNPHALEHACHYALEEHADAHLRSMGYEPGTVEVKS